ncbi:hypothetical protein CIK99_13820 [Prevotella sp. P5-92]|uniref:hypothetical protein n=1 Tax=Prevotella sp. P5-92 TaxID=2024222 RepID=UPI000B976FE2|nr:hypothetical protein [Prevotella sp. P5-92]OYP54300.1 hypothetical protein CIK99_13820 [Prevotella sp. P5-92]
MNDLVQNLWNSFMSGRQDVVDDSVKPTNTLEPATIPTPPLKEERKAVKKSFAEELNDLIAEKGDFERLEISLKELLAIISRHRPRIEAYRGFISYATNQGKSISIISNKTKKK